MEGSIYLENQNLRINELRLKLRIEDLEDELSELKKQLMLGGVSNRRELLLAFMEYHNNKVEIYKEGIGEFEIDDYLANNCC